MSPIEVMARSDAEFDGRPWDGMSTFARNRYLARSEAALKALAASKSELTIPEFAELAKRYFFLKSRKQRRTM